MSERGPVTFPVHFPSVYDYGFMWLLSWVAGSVVQSLEKETNWEWSRLHGNGIFKDLSRKSLVRSADHNRLQMVTFYSMEFSQTWNDWARDTQKDLPNHRIAPAKLKYLL